jgi:phosphoesterase RecJ-like protein
MWSEIAQVIHQKQRFIITTHTNPDLDGLGAELALEEQLRSLHKDAVILNSDPIPRGFRSFDPRRRLRVFSASRHQKTIERAEVILVLDASGGWERVGRLSEPLSARAGQPGVVSVCIDHHPDPADFVDLAVVDPGAAATAELIFDLIHALDGALTPSIAGWLYLGILTDTGSFRYPKTSRRTHEIAGRLIEAGADPLHLYKQVYEQYPLRLVRLKGHVLNSLCLAAGGQLAWCALDRATLRSYGVRSSELDGFPGLAMQIGGVRVSLLCVEISRGRVKASLRSDGSVAVNELAARWGGGGHPSAAGAIIEGKLDEVTQQLASSVEALLDG